MDRQPLHARWTGSPSTPVSGSAITPVRPEPVEGPVRV